MFIIILSQEVDNLQLIAVEISNSLMFCDFFCNFLIPI